MLPDFPDFKKKCCEALVQHVSVQSRKDGLLAQIPVGRDFEGDKMSSGDVSGNVRESQYTEISSESSIPRDELIEKGIIAYIERADKVAEDMQRKQAQMVFKQLQEVTEATGNVVDNQGKPLSADTFLSALEKVWVDFDDNGNPYMPSLVVHPTLGEKLQKLMPEWEADPAIKEKFERIMTQKKKEWDDRESCRKLVD